MYERPLYCIKGPIKILLTVTSLLTAAKSLNWLSHINWKRQEIVSAAQCHNLIHASRRMKSFALSILVNNLPLRYRIYLKVFEAYRWMQILLQRSFQLSKVYFRPQWLFFFVNCACRPYDSMTGHLKSEVWFTKRKERETTTGLEGARHSLEAVLIWPYLGICTKRNRDVQVVLLNLPVDWTKMTGTWTRKKAHAKRETLHC